MAQIIDQKQLFDFQTSIVPQAAAADVNGVAVDTLGFGSAFLFGQLDDAATGSFKLQESDDGATGWADVADDEVVTADGSNDTAGVASSFVTIGYVGLKRYLRVVFTHTGSGDISAGVALGCPDIAPTGANS